MAPNGLIITKLGVQVTAHDDSARIILCLKISLPRETEAKQAVRWGLFSNSTPHLSSPPQIHPLPLTYTSPPSDQIITATLLLSLPNPTKGTGERADKSMIEFHPSSGQVYVSLDQGGKKRRSSMSATASPAEGTARREYLVLMECEQAVDRISGWFQLNLPIPKSLDNIIRFQILPPTSSSWTSTGEVSIVTEPKILPLSSSPAIKKTSSPKSRPLEEDGWEDGESLGPEDLGSESEEGGSWLEGRFQSTDQLRLEWSFASTPPNLPLLNVIPSWDNRHSSIHVDYSATTYASTILPIEAVIPDGWSWSELDIQSDHLLSWHSTDGDWWDTLLSSISIPSDPDESSTTEVEDSFSTIRARRNGNNTSRTVSSGASLMRHPSPQPDPSMDEFSFELAHSAATPLIPRSKGGSVMSDMKTENRPPKVLLTRPAPARYLELEFEGDVEEAEIRISGRLVPQSRTVLVSPSVPVDIPFFRLPDIDDRCQLVMSGETESTLVDLSDSPRFSWKDQSRFNFRSSANGMIRGDVHVKLKKYGGGLQMSITIQWPKASHEIVFALPRPSGVSEKARVVKAVMLGRTLPRAVTPVEKGIEVHIGKGALGDHGECVIVIELEGEGVILPIFEGAEGRMQVELVGSGWNGRMRTNLTRLSSTSYSLSLPSTATPYLTLSPIPRSTWSFTFSWSTLVNLFLLYLFVSLAQQVQRLRSEVAFIAEEAKDLRMYSSKVEEMERRVRYDWEQADSGLTPHEAGPSQHMETLLFRQEGGRVGAEDLQRRHQSEPWDRAGGGQPTKATALARVVLGQTSWERWMLHPTFQSLGRSLGWLWHTVVWLVHA